jgi:hypothetical protein
MEFYHGESRKRGMGFISVVTASDDNVTLENDLRFIF